MSADALDTYLDNLFRSRPELRLALPYLDAAGHACLTAFACLEQQWGDSVYGIAETPVLSAKLAWWRDELAAARAGHGHHPLATALFANASARAIEAELWQAALSAGLAVRERAPAADFAAQLSAAENFHGTLAVLETRLWFAEQADPARAIRLAALSHMRAALLHLGRDDRHGDAVPMNLLARHQLTRAELAVHTAACNDLVKDQLDDLQSAFNDAMSLPGPTSLFCKLGRQADQQQLRAALRARQPLQVLAADNRRIGPRMAWYAWRVGRQQRRSQH